MTIWPADNSDTTVKISLLLASLMFQVSVSISIPSKKNPDGFSIVKCSDLLQVLSLHLLHGWVGKDNLSCYVYASVPNKQDTSDFLVTAVTSTLLLLLMRQSSAALQEEKFPFRPAGEFAALWVKGSLFPRHKMSWPPVTWFPSIWAEWLKNVGLKNHEFEKPDQMEQSHS